MKLENNADNNAQVDNAAKVQVAAAIKAIEFELYSELQLNTHSVQVALNKIKQVLQLN